jgi:hypothetical protein
MSKRKFVKGFTLMSAGSHKCIISRVEENVVKKSAKWGDKPGVAVYFKDVQTGDEIRQVYTDPGDKITAASNLGKLVALLYGGEYPENRDFELQDLVGREVMVMVKHTSKTVDGKSKTYGDVATVIPLDLETYLPGQAVERGEVYAPGLDREA